MSPEYHNLFSVTEACLPLYQWPSILFKIQEDRIAEAQLPNKGHLSCIWIESVEVASRTSRAVIDCALPLQARDRISFWGTQSSLLINQGWAFRTTCFTHVSIIQCVLSSLCSVVVSFIGKTDWRDKKEILYNKI